MSVVTIGLDLAKTVFQAHGVDEAGVTVLRRKLARADMMPFSAKQPPCVIGMEACPSAHHWALACRNRPLIRSELALDLPIASAIGKNVADCRRCRPVPEAIVDCISPELRDAGSSLPLRQYRHAGLITEDPRLSVDNSELQLIEASGHQAAFCIQTTGTERSTTMPWPASISICRLSGIDQAKRAVAIQAMVDVVVMLPSMSRRGAGACTIPVWQWRQAFLGRMSTLR